MDEINKIQRLNLAKIGKELHFLKVFLHQQTQVMQTNKEKL